MEKSFRLVPAEELPVENVVYSLFPSKIVNKAEDFSILEYFNFFPDKKNFKATDFAQNCYPVTPFIQPENRVVVAQLKEEGPLTGQHFIYTRKTCQTEQCFYVEDFNWEKVTHKYRRNPSFRTTKKSNNLM